MRKDILLCGVGGQGTVLASKLIASAAMRGGEVVHSAETIGMAQRGGCVTSHVRIGAAAYAPLIPLGAADLILAFEPAEAARNLCYLKSDGFVIVNCAPVPPVTESLHPTGYDGSEMLNYLRRRCHHVLVIDGDAICKKLGSPKFLNVALLGAAVGTSVTGLEPRHVLEEIDARVPKKYRATNQQAFRMGKQIGESYEIN